MTGYKGLIQAFLALLLVFSMIMSPTAIASAKPDQFGNALLGPITTAKSTMSQLSSGSLSSAASIEWKRQDIGWGWSSSQIKFVISAGDLDGNGYSDMMLTDTKGLLWYYPAVSSTQFAPRTEAGHGWTSMNRLFGGVDFNGDGNIDILGIDKSGILYMYPGIGNGYFRTKVKIGTGWSHVQNISITEAGFNGSPMIMGSLNGILKAWQTNGRGSFLKTVTYGNGWDGIKQTAIGPDVTRDGIADMWAITTTGELRLYAPRNKSAKSFYIYNKLGTGWAHIRNFFPTNKASVVRAVTADGILRQYSIKAFQPRWINRSAPITKIRRPSVPGTFFGNNMNIALSNPRARVSIPSGANCHIGVSRTSVTEPMSCTYGTGKAELNIVVAGDSHAAGWAPAFESLADAGYFNLTYQTRDSCSLHDRGHETDSCLAWKSNVIRWLQNNPPDVLVLGYFTLTKTLTATQHEASMRDLLEQIPAETQVVILRDTPKYPKTPADCIPRHLDNVGACGVSKEQGLDTIHFNVNSRLAKEYGAKMLDMTPYICSDFCPMILGNTSIVVDQHHLSREFAGLMTNALLSELKSIDFFTPKNAVIGGSRKISLLQNQEFRLRMALLPSKNRKTLCLN